jgi:hypothetical protein
MTVKNKKIKCFYPIIRSEKPNVIKIRHFIHSPKSEGFWATIRDFSQEERTANDSVGHNVAVKITVGYNLKLIDNYEKLIIIDSRGTTYRIKEKPDEFFYGGKGDITFTAYAFDDATQYDLTADEYEY